MRVEYLDTKLKDYFGPTDSEIEVSRFGEQTFRELINKFIETTNLELNKPLDDITDDQLVAIVYTINEHYKSKVNGIKYSHSVYQLLSTDLIFPSVDELKKYADRFNIKYKEIEDITYELKVVINEEDEYGVK